MHQQTYRKGMKDGIPVGLGYFVVSFTIGIAARKANLTPLQATIMSFTNNTSAGQFASFALIASGAPYLEMVISQAVINLRYCLMSCALSQKVDGNMPFYHRLFMAFGVTDEIFGLSISQKGKLDPWYTYGVMSVAVPGWSLGTLTGVLSTGMLPQTFLNAMNMALYGMFIAIFMPAAREDKKLLPVIFISMALSTLVQVMPAFDFISSGMKIIILTLTISIGAAILMPIPEEEGSSMRNYMYILVMAVTTYLIRVIPLAFLRKEIKNRTFRSFLTYVPYVTLSVMTFPAILESTEQPWISLVGFVAAMVMGYCRVSLFVVSMGCCLLVFLLQMV